MLALPLAIVWFGALIVALLDGRKRWVATLAAALLAAALLATLWLSAAVVRDGPIGMVAGDWPVGVGIRLRADSLGVLFIVVSLAVLLAALVYEAAGGVQTRTFPALTLAMGAGLTGLFLTNDVFNFYVFFEIAMIAAYVLTGYGSRLRQLRSAVIFSVVNLVGSVVFLFAIVSLYHVTGSLDMDVMRLRLPVVEPNASLLVGTALFIAFGIKLGLFPFHPWLPPVYTGARPAVAAMLSGALANIGSYGLLRFGAGILPRDLELAAPALIVLGAASIIYGGMQAVGRNAPEEVLAYSAIGQVGYVMIALGIGGPIGFAAAILYTILNGINKTLLFLAVGARGWLLGIPFAIGAFSVAGVPPVGGFWSKAIIIQTTLAADSDGARIWLTALMVVGGALSFVYMFQVYQHEFWEPRDEPRRPGPVGRRAIVALLAIVVVAIGIVPEPLLSASARAAAVLTGGAP
ncbi:MAG: oxidoreductase [Thermomicrobiales bacterium]|nr:oxidoreductase [Thermomicrobiales bacterium]